MGLALESLDLLNLKPKPTRALGSAWAQAAAPVLKMTAVVARNKFKLKFNLKSLIHPDNSLELYPLPFIIEESVPAQVNDALYVSSGSRVALKKLFKEDHPYADIVRYLSSELEPLSIDSCNHCVPLLDVLHLPLKDGDWDL